MKADELRKRTTNVYFAKRFSELITEWKKRTGMTQKQFATLCYSNPNSITNYKNGVDFPSPATIDQIISVFNDAELNVTIEDFIPHGNDDTYKYDPSRVKAIQDHNQEYVEEIGLSDGFLDFVFNHTDFSDPNEGYPIWSPLALMPFKPEPFKTEIEDLKYLNDMFLVHEYGRLELMKTHVVPENQKFAVKMQDGSTVILTRIDLRILKDLQDKIVDVVKYIYFTRRKEMKSQVINATKQANPQLSTNNGRGIGINGSLSKNELIAIDPYMQYLTWVDENGKEI